MFNLNRLAIAVILLTVGTATPELRQFASTDAARDFVYVLERTGVNTIAAVDPADPGAFVAALYVGGRDLMVIRARHPAVRALGDHVAARQDVRVFDALRATPTPEGKLYVRDVNANGILSAAPAATDVDVASQDGRPQIHFNGDFESQGLSAAEYDARLAAADAEYARLVKILTAAVRARLAARPAPEDVLPASAVHSLGPRRYEDRHRRPAETDGRLRESRVVEQFRDRVDKYMAVRMRAVEVTGSLEPAAAATLTAQREALGAEIRRRRSEAMPGDIFAPEIRRHFRELLAPVFEGERSDDVRFRLNDDAPDVDAVPLEVNGRYPAGLPFATTPWPLLAKLPTLPPGLSYRFVGSDLLLLDQPADLIVDYMRNALPRRPAP